MHKLNCGRFIVTIKPSHLVIEFKQRGHIVKINNLPGAEKTLKDALRISTTEAAREMLISSYLFSFFKTEADRLDAFYEQHTQDRNRFN